ncbi:uncharacterized protein TM35_000491210 [Trypanosoma theileri]|uniref:Iron-sulfur assembly protein 2 n=1 Tax=Trypanosoma theileri TaxID=67003 RepID=A0A1X0NHC3_9TRYP|nr:uncharacterized protein TM35_000491210 [Trypanosoma theileri]ORC84115.1 hypothetical protein TM35_000491210 [Trypanosoma theileri]
MLRRSYFLLCLPLLSSVYGNNFTVSDRVWRRITEKNAEEGFTNDRRFLRLAIDSGGCHGYAYKFSLEENDQLEPAEDVVVSEIDAHQLNSNNNNNNNNNNKNGNRSEGGDQQELESQGPPPRVVVDKHSVSKLQSAVIDFHSELKGAAFVVVGNELVDQSCACAMSFSLKKRPGK